MLMVEPLERPLSSYIHTQFVTADENSSVAEAVKGLQSILFTIVTALSIYYLAENKIIFIDAGFEATTSISNNGLSVGITTLDMDSISKLILSFNMIIGRFEIIAILYIFISKLRR
jgi:Trk-type K+ transport system membrane component